MKNAFVLTLSTVFTLGLFSEPSLASTYQGTLVVEKPMEIAMKSKKSVLEKGSYQASIKMDDTGIFVLKKVLDYNIQTDQGLLSGRMKYKKKNENILEDQKFNTKESFDVEEKVVSDAKTETRKCVKQSFTTQENCRIEQEFECDGLDHFGCEGHWKDVIVCDTVTHNIYGKQNVTFHKTIRTTHEKIEFLDKADSSLIASLTESKSSDSEKIVSKTDCD